MSTTLLSLLPVLIISLIAAVLILVWWVWQRHQREQAARDAQQRAADEAAALMAAEQAAIEAARVAPIPTGGIEINLPQAAVDIIPGGSRHMMVVAAGTFGASEVRRYLIKMHQCGLENEIGSILLVEFDTKHRQNFIDEIGRVAPVYLNRLVYVGSAYMSAGGKNRTHEEIDKDEDHWLPEIVDRVNEACHLHERLDPETNQPSLVVTFISTGASGYMGRKAVEEIAQRYPNAQQVGFVAYPVHTRLRQRVPAQIKAYMTAGCHRFIVADNLADQLAPRRDYMINDTGMLIILLVLLSASQGTDSVTEEGNAFTLMFPEEGGLASYSTFITELPARVHQLHSAVEPRFYVHHRATRDRCLNALKRVKEEGRKAVSTRFGLHGTTRFDMLHIPLEPNSLRRLEDDINHSYKVVGLLVADYELLFAGGKTLIDPADPICPIVVVSPIAITDAEKHLEEVATGGSAEHISADSSALREQSLSAASDSGRLNGHQTTVKDEGQYEPAASA